MDELQRVVQRQLSQLARGVFGSCQVATGECPLEAGVGMAFRRHTNVCSHDSTWRGAQLHLAFPVDDVHLTLERLLAAGGSANGEIAEVAVDGVGTAEFVYARDPDGNIVELQGWKS